jgi:hypothetical protein
MIFSLRTHFLVVPLLAPNAGSFAKVFEKGEGTPWGRGEKGRDCYTRKRDAPRIPD